MKKIIYPTTLNYNPGDEIIYRGVKNCIDDLIGETMPLFWNRHPSISPSNQSYDNSFSPVRDRDFKPSYMIFSGSPSWYGSGVWDLYKWLIKSNTRCSFVGIGTSEENPKIDPYVKTVLNERADVILCRDAHTAEVISKLVDDKEKVKVLPCPSVMSYRDSRIREHKKVVGLTYQGNSMKWQNADADLSASFKKLHGLLSEKYDVRIYAHFVKDMIEAEKVFGRDEPIYFSSKPEDLQRWFSDTDLIIGPRLHGCLGCVATGGTAILTHAFKNVRRRGAAAQIPVLDTVGEDPEEAFEKALAMDVVSRSSEIKVFTKDVIQMYHKELVDLPEWIRQSEEGQLDYKGGLDLGPLMHLIQRIPYMIGKRF
jgi:hypothetical protein